MTTAELLVSIDNALANIKALPRRRITILIVPPTPSAPINELAAMHADADALESGEHVAAFRLTDEQLTEIHAENIGVEYCTAPYNW